MRQCKLGKLCWVATASRPDIRAKNPQGSDAHRISDLNKTAEEWPRATILKYASSPFPNELVPRGDPVDGEARKMRARGGKVHRGTLTLAGRSDAAYGERTKEGCCRLGYVIGLISSTWR